MKITDLSVTLFKWDSAAWTTGKMAFGGARRLGVVTVHTDEGIEGHAFLGSARESADVFCGPLVEWLKPTLVGRNPLDTGALWTAMWMHKRYVSIRAIGAVDVALWDLAGKVAKLPIHRLLGTCRESVPAYASSAYLPTPEAYVEEALHFLSLGWPAYMLRGDVMVTGGITPLIKVAHMADGFRMKCEIHHGGNSLGNGANKYGLVEDIEVDKQGFVHAPQKPGLGFEIDWELVKRNKVAVLN